MQQLRGIRLRARRIVGAALRKYGLDKRLGLSPVVDTFTWPPEDLQMTDAPAYGEQLHAQVMAARAVKPSHNWGKVYDIVKAEFDYPFYLSNNPDIAQLHLDPVAHYLKAGAREGRDPAPWFSSAEYRKAYQPRPEDRVVNPFYHYLTVGRSAGHSPRAPHGYEEFCATIGSNPVETSARVKARIEDVRQRLAHGTLGEMVQKAARHDPLVAHSWHAAMKVRVPPSSNAIGTRRIAHLRDMFAQVDHQRADLVIVAEGGASASQHDVLHQTLVMLATQVPADRIVVLFSKGGAAFESPVDGVRVVDFNRMRPRQRNYESGRSLIEIIRALRPANVVNLNARLFWLALPTYGRALAASSRIIHLLHIQATDWTQKSEEQVLAGFYRAFDTDCRIVTIGQDLKDRLQEQFLVPENIADLVTAVDVPMMTDDIDLADPTGQDILWVGNHRVSLAPQVSRQLGREIVAFDPNLTEDTTVGAITWRAIPKTGLPLTSAGLVLLDYPLKTLTGFALDVIAAGVPLAGQFAPQLQAALGDNVAPLPDSNDPEVLANYLTAVLADASTWRDRAMALRQQVQDRDAKAAKAAFSFPLEVQK